MVIRELGDDDNLLLESAVARFRNSVVADAAGFLADPATVVVVAMADADAVIGWAWGTRQRHPAATHS
jgi:hypothetical protein